MDLKFKGASWVGNVYQKFEAICHEVDEIVHQDKIKYVENQMHTVGKSVKKLYSGLLLPLEDPTVDPVTNQQSLVFIEHQFEDQLSSPISMDSLEESESNKAVGKVNNILKDENSVMNNEETVKPLLSELTSHGRKDHCAVSPIGVFVRSNHENKEAELSNDAHESSTYKLEFNTEKNPKREPNVMEHHLQDTLEESGSNLCTGKIDGSVASDYTDASNDETTIEVCAPILLESTSGVAEHFAMSPIGVLNHSNDEARHANLSETSPETSLEFESLQNWTVWDDFVDEVESVSGASNADESSRGSENLTEKLIQEALFSPNSVDCASSASNTTSEMAVLVVSGDKATEKVGFPSSSSCKAKESLELTDALQMLSLKSILCHSSGEMAGSASDSSNECPSSAPALTVSSKNKDLKGVLSSFSSVLSFKSVAKGTTRITESSMPLSVPSEKQQFAICKSDQHEVIMSSSKTGYLDESSDDIAYCHMESIDLHDKVKIQERCVEIVDTELHAVSRRARKQRSYKKRIQDAFTSNKRLVKEYEQLAIWFGDADIDSSQEGPSKKETLQTHHAGDSEWELL